MRRKLAKIYRASTKFLSQLKWFTLIQPLRLVAVFRGSNAVISSWPAAPVSLRPKVALFMHYDRAGRVPGPVIGYIEDLIANGFSVVFVTNSGILTEAGEARLKAICAAVFVRHNRGYDFGAWRDVIDALRLPAANTEELLIINDSMYGPLAPLAPTLAKLDYQVADIWGLTESWQERYHLQSFFLAFGPAALQSPAFKQFWHSVKPVPSKTYIVRQYEVGLTQVMMKAGLRCEAIWRYENLVKMVGTTDLREIFSQEAKNPTHGDPLQIARKLQMLRIRAASVRRVAMNPTADLWRQLLMSGFPFIKRELLRDNPSEVEDLADWVEVVRAIPDADPDPILAELRTRMKGGVP
jgi:hypothetical protein